MTDSLLIAPIMELKLWNKSALSSSVNALNRTNNGIETCNTSFKRPSSIRLLIAPIMELKHIRNLDYGQYKRPLNRTNNGIETETQLCKK